MKNQIIDFVFFGLLAIGPPCVPPILIWGWIRWWKGRAERNHGQFVSFVGLLFTTASALFAAGVCLYPARVAESFDLDPIFGLLLRLGMRTALAALPFSIVGVGWPNPARWQALASSLLAPFFWLGVGWDL